MKDKKLISLIVAGAVIIGFLASNIFSGGSFTAGSVANPKCTVSSTEVAPVGNEISVTILSANETRAWARIQNILHATNTVSLSFDEGNAAVLDEGVFLSAASTTNETHDIVFGRATHFPYTGVVTGITDVGSSTVLVTECVY